jgi:hypothetical protein
MKRSTRKVSTLFGKVIPNKTFLVRVNGNGNEDFDPASDLAIVEITPGLKELLVAVRNQLHAMKIDID